MWIAVDTNLLNSRLAVDMAEALAIEDHEVVGLLVLFWSAVKTLDRDGVVGDLSDAHLERLARWRGTRGVFAKFIRERHLDADGRVRDWKDYQRDLQRNWRDSKRKSRGCPQDIHRTSGGHHQDVHETSGGHHQDVHEMSVECPKPTVQEQEQVQEQPPPLPPAGGGGGSMAPTVAFASAVNAALDLKFGEHPNRLALHGSGATLKAVRSLTDAGARVEDYPALVALALDGMTERPRSPSAYFETAMLRLFVEGALAPATTPEARAAAKAARKRAGGASPPPPSDDTGFVPPYLAKRRLAQQTAALTPTGDK